MWRTIWKRVGETVEDNWVELAAWSAVVLLFTLAFFCLRFVLDSGRH